MIVSLVAALAENHVIGQDGDLPWHLPEDLKFFKRLTTGHPVVMGRKTFLEVGAPLPHRTNVVITRSANFRAEGVRIAGSLDEALDPWRATDEEVFVVGGGEIYRLALPRADRLYLTRIHGTVDGDTFFPPFDLSQWHLVSSEAHPADTRHAYPFTFERYERKG